MKPTERGIAGRSGAPAPVTQTSQFLFCLERNLRPHRAGIELRTYIAGVGGADLFGDIAVKVIEHEPDIVIGCSFERSRGFGVPTSYLRATIAAGGTASHPSGVS